MRRKAIFIAATGQNVGKTTVCLGVISGLKKKFPNLGFMKPLGQQHEKILGDLLVDKDVILFKEYFHLPSNYKSMSPIIFPSGFTRDFLDKKIDEKEIEKNILDSFDEIYAQNDFTIVEGTGHVGVGSIINFNNAKVASLLDLDMVIIVNAGLGSAFDELALNKAMCEQHKVKIRGVILNRVMENKREMIIEYMQKALKRWDIPLIGCVPYNQFLSTPSMQDFEILFKTKLLSGEEYATKHFDTIRLVATSVETFKEMILSSQLIVTPATREDIILELINLRGPNQPEHGIILTGRHPPAAAIINKLKESKIPSLYASKSSFIAMQMITSFNAKTRKEDIAKVEKAIAVVESHLDFSILL